jgi:membrane complex biogenesis BtpA family protein
MGEATMVDRNSATGFRELFAGGRKPVIAMSHVPALPGAPLYDEMAGIDGLVSAVRRDVDILVRAGVDAILFCNENDRPYELSAGLISAAVMTRVVTECRPTTIPFGVDFLWDANCALSVAIATDADFIREVVTGAWESDMGLWQPDAAKLLRDRRAAYADNIAVLANVTPEFASPIGNRSPAQVASSVVVSTLADAILVSGAMAAAEPQLDTIKEVRAALPEGTPLLLNTGAKSANIQQYMPYIDGCIVGSDLKVDGKTWNPVDPERVDRFLTAMRAVAG